MTSLHLLRIVGWSVHSVHTFSPRLCLKVNLEGLHLAGVRYRNLAVLSPENICKKLCVISHLTIPFNCQCKLWSCSCFLCISTHLSLEVMQDCGSRVATRAPGCPGSCALSRPVRLVWLLFEQHSNLLLAFSCIYLPAPHQGPSFPVFTWTSDLIAIFTTSGE